MRRSPVREKTKRSVILCLFIFALLLTGVTGCAVPANRKGAQAESVTAAAADDGVAETAETVISVNEPEPEEAEAPAEILPDEGQETDASGDFYITEITDDIRQRIEGKSYKEDCTVPMEDLRYIHVLHTDKDGVTHEGEMVCNAFIAEDLIEIFRELYEAGYPIEKMRLVDEYDADDELSMEDNNSSSFNFRFISHTTRVSKHGLGLAVDINTLYNPYIKYVDGERVLEPVTAEEYLDREKDFDYKINKGDLCYRLFTEHGFEWGGDWSDRKDYQHFELPDAVIEREGLQPAAP